MDSPTYNPSALSTPHLYPKSPLHSASKLEFTDVKPVNHVPRQIPGLPPLLNTSGRLIGVVADPRSVKWPAGLSSAVQTGEDAKMIMGKPIVPITPSSDCWGSISDAEVVDAGEFKASLRHLPNSVSIIDAQEYLRSRSNGGESSGSSSNNSS